MSETVLSKDFSEPLFGNLLSNCLTWLRSHSGEAAALYRWRQSVRMTILRQRFLPSCTYCDQLVLSVQPGL